MSFSSTRQPPTANPQSTLRAESQSRAVFFTTSAILYTTAIVLATLTLNPYFAQTWDVTTFIQAGHRFLDGNNPLDLYAQSRAAQTWPYAYPPLHAAVVAIALLVGKLVPILPDYVWARVPVIAADIAIGILLHRIVQKKSGDETLARMATLVWLFNPITFYDTAVQGHFESEWLVFVLLAYLWFDNARPLAWSAVALAIAVLFKQTAIVFAIPLWIYMLMRENGQRSAVSGRVLRILASGFIFALVVGVVCLPFLLYSNDFVYMNLTYVENVPVQAQSWFVALLGITRTAPNAMTSDFVLMRYQTIITIITASVIAFLGARRGFSIYLTAMLIAIAFFLTSKKVMGYYYVMLFPFLLAELLPRRRFNRVLIALVVTTWISLSPYYASWTNHAHWWIYAILGIANSLFFVWLFVKMTNDGGRMTDDRDFFVLRPPSSVIMISSGLFAGAIGAALLQPLAGDNGSPIRAPIIAPGMETIALVVLGVLIAFIAVIMIAIYRATKFMSESVRLGAWSVPLFFAPLFFSVYYLTKETTAIFEIVLKALGV